MAHHSLSLRAKLLVGAVALVALVAMCSALPRTACPRRIGFDAVPDKIAFNTPNGYYGASQPIEAGALCAAEPLCVSYDTLGVRNFRELGPMVDSPGACTYIKQACPPSGGYQTLVNKMWVVTQSAVATGVVSANQGSAAEAAVYCNATASCLAWNNKGETLNLPPLPPPPPSPSTNGAAVDAAPRGGMDAAAAAGVTFPSAPKGTCTYLKDPCLPRYGFTLKRGVRFVAATGLAGARLGAMGSAAEAEDFCKLSPKCTAWSTAGQVVVGGIKSYEPARGVCSYIKQPCPAVPGFTAYEGVTMPASSPPNDGRNPATSFADLVAHCTVDPRCTVFDTLRRTWSLGHGAEPTAPFPGMCTFVKMSVLL